MFIEKDLSSVAGNGGHFPFVVLTTHKGPRAPILVESLGINGVPMDGPVQSLVEISRIIKQTHIGMTRKRIKRLAHRLRRTQQNFAAGR